MVRRAVIMAGGSGTRMWPMSRQLRPKQLLKIVGGKSLLRISYDRLRTFLKPEEILVIASAAYIDQVHAELPDIPEANLIGEPCGRDTAAAVGMAAAVLHSRDPETVMSVFTADHIITPIETFVASIEAGFAAAERHADALVTFGITPTWAHTGLGYVQRGAELGPGLYEVAQFKEKPDAATAQQYLDSGQYYWNSGMFAWRTETVLSQLAQHLPDSHAKLMQMGQAWDTPRGKALADEVYPTLEKISVDFGIMEKADRVLVVPMPCQWLDVGSWTAMDDAMDADADGNVRSLPNVATIDASNNILVADDDHLVAAIGVTDLIIVHTADATLVCHKNDAQKIKAMVDHLKQAHGEKYQ